MSLKICSISSGSSGNCIFVSSATTNILVDVGVSALRVARALAVLKVNPAAATILVTHSHSDHIGCVPAFCSRYGNLTYAHYGTSEILSDKMGAYNKKVIPFGDEDFYIGDITVSSFKVSHDVPCVGYSFMSGGTKISLATDLGCIDNNIISRISDSDVVLLECNHDEQLLKNNPRYVPWLKKRILGDSGHLSNNACAAAAVSLAAGGVKQIILGHLSKENNYPELAYATVRLKLDSLGYTGVQIEVASPDKLSGLYEIL